MAKSRKINNALIRVLDQSSSIVYLVSDELKLTYANEACALWVGLDLETLVETKLIYTSETLEDAAENSAKGLAIAPHLVDSQQVSSMTLNIFSVAGGSQAVRSANAEPVFDHRGQFLGYLVISNLSHDAAAAPDVPETINSPAKQHEALALFRERLQKRFDSKQLVGTSIAADRVRRQVSSAIASEGDVLVVGPEGSGREHIARSIVSHSLASADEASEVLVPLHCSITDPTQVQQTMKELLNHSTSSPTLLLIDVDQMDAGSQQELLGYLQLPGLSARMIATSSSQLTNSESFHAALASRLSTLVIELAPLAERREDLPLLAQAILESRNDQGTRQFSGFTRQANEMICEYDWPGNFGQLAAAIDEAAANAGGPVIQVADFSTDFQHAIKAQQFAIKAETKIQLDQYLLDVEQQLVERAVAQAKGNKTKAAELLGINRAKLLRRLAALQQVEVVDGSELLDPSVFTEASDE